jgi:hypothetical protein
LAPTGIFFCLSAFLWQTTQDGVHEMAAFARWFPRKELGSGTAADTIQW